MRHHFVYVTMDVCVDTCECVSGSPEKDTILRKRSMIGTKDLVSWVMVSSDKTFDTVYLGTETRSKITCTQDNCL